MTRYKDTLQDKQDRQQDEQDMLQDKQDRQQDERLGGNFPESRPNPVSAEETFASSWTRAKG